MKWTERLVVAKISLACLVGIALAMGAGNAHVAAQAFSSWSGAGGDGDWNNVANWSSGSLDVDTGLIDPDGLVVPDPTTALDDSYVGGRINRGDAETDPPTWPLLSAPISSFPVVTAATSPIPVVNRFNLNTGNDSFDGVEALFTVDGGRVDVAGGGSNSALSIGRSTGKTLPAGSVPKSTLIIQNGGEIFVGGVLHPAINGGFLPSAPAGMQVRLGQSNIVIDGPGSKLVVTDQLRYTGSSSSGKNPLPGSGIVVSNGGYLEAGNLRLERLNGLDGLDLMMGVTPGSNAGFLDIVGPDSSVKVFDAFAGGGTTLLEKLQYLVNVDGVIVADGGDPTMRVSIADLGGGASYLLTSVAIPEPSSIVLVGMLFAGFVARRRR
ncbi:MAG: PEP-CTERM sorting domain-containing protein [Planctomycetes bacterium]|nr:PEP-CTERM sorting domain-containing protein [Planctomycetota bacterium]